MLPAGSNDHGDRDKMPPRSCVAKNTHQDDRDTLVYWVAPEATREVGVSVTIIISEVLG